jgi:hypothetical protein
MNKLALIALVAFVAAPIAAQSARPPFALDDGQFFYRLDDAVRAANGGDAVITIAPGTYPECAVVERGRLTLRAEKAGTAIFDGGTCEGKATIVTRADELRIEGLVFQNIRVPDRNGAGIRLERGDLVVTNSLFRNSEQGILTANDPQGAITIDKSTFSGLGGCPNGQCSHSIYIGDYGKLTVTRSRFERGTGGHYVKTRAAVVDVRDSSFDDTRGKATNYMIDLSAGATGVISGNVFVQGRDKENYSALIAVAPEARSNRSAGLQIAGNDASIAPGIDRATVFVADWSREPLKIGANKIGPGIKAFESR